MMVNMSLSISMEQYFFCTFADSHCLWCYKFATIFIIAVDRLLCYLQEKVAQLGAPVFLAPIAASANNVYITWSSNKTGGDFEVMFRASIDNGQTFGPKINLSNTTGVDSLDPSIGSIRK